GRRPGVLHLFVASLELDAERLREVLPEVVRRAGLERATVAHQRLDRIRPRRAGELLRLALLSVDDGQRQLVLGALLVEREDLQRFFLRLSRSLVRRVSFLP